MARGRYPFGRFPFPVAPTTSPPFDRPGVPLDVAMRWYWRVRTWDVSFSASATLDFDTNLGHCTISMGASVSNVFGRPLLPYYGANLALITDTEANLVLPLPLAPQPQDATYGGAVIRQDKPHLIPPPPPLTVGGVISLAWFTNFGAVQAFRGFLYCPVTGLFYPDFNLDLSLLGDGGDSHSGGMAVATGVFIPPVDPEVKPDPTTSVDITGLIDGYACDLGAAQVHGGGNIVDGVANAVFTGLSASFTMTPRTYWSYAGVDGVALWDASTGEPAINPATGSQWTPAQIAAASVP